MFRNEVADETQKIKKVKKNIDKKLLFYIVRRIDHPFIKVITNTVKG